jgi:hypothetical protein
MVGVKLLFQGAPRAGEQRFERIDAELEYFGRFAVGETLVVTQDKGTALALGQRSEQALHAPRETLALLPVNGITIGVLVGTIDRRITVSAIAPIAAGISARLALLPTQHVDAEISGDIVQPRRESGAPGLEARRSGPEAK